MSRAERHRCWRGLLRQFISHMHVRELTMLMRSTGHAEGGCGDKPCEETVATINFDCGRFAESVQVRYTHSIKDVLRLRRYVMRSTADG